MDFAALIATWRLVEQTAGQLFVTIQDDYRPAFTALAGEYGLTTRQLAHFAYVVENFDPEALSVAAYLRRSPYDHPRSVENFLVAWTDAGLVRHLGAEQYELTATGMDVCRSRWQIADPLFAALTPLSVADMKKLLALLEQLVIAATAAPQPASLWALRTRLNHGLAVKDEAAPLWQLLQRRMDLLALRDDAHLASWQERYRVEAFAWEALSLIWLGEAGDVRQIAAHLTHRGEGFTVHDYELALQALASRGWVEPAADGEGFELTPAGQAVRERAEDETNQYFFAPWAVLTAKEQAALFGTLKLLLAGLQRIVALRV